MKVVQTSLVVLFSLAVVFGCQPEKKPEAKSEQKPPPPRGTLKSLGIKDTKVGMGKDAAKSGDTVIMLYTGKLADGTVFDSTDKHDGEPFSFKLGKGEVIKGWDQGIVGMKVGGERDLAIPGDLGYGEKGAAGAGIGPNADLFFHVKLVDMIKAGDEDLVVTTDLKKGTGRQAKEGDTVTVHYVGTLPGGKVFDSSRAKNRPFQFKLGAGQVVKGFDWGVRGMKVGGLRKVHIPPMLGYGPVKAGPIPPNSILTFEIELLKVQ